MNSRFPLALVALIAALGAISWSPSRDDLDARTATDRADDTPSARVEPWSLVPRPGIGTVGTAAPLASDSARAELAAGRYWHAARLLREAGAAEGSAADVLTLARAEAGWESWPAVVELLEGATWLGTEEGGVGLYLLARGLETEERWAEARDRYAAFAATAPAEGPAAAAAWARGARAAWHAGDVDGALRALDALGSTPAARSWAAVELALAAADEGDVLGVERLRSHAIEPRAASAVWRVEADVLLAAGDSARAAETFEALRGATEGRRRVVATVELGRLRLAAGDSAEAGRLLAEALPEATGGARVRAAEALHDIGGHGFERTLELARILDRAGDGARALRGYDRARELAAASTVVFPERSRLERARLMATVASRQDEALEEFREIRATTESDRVGARNLEVWAQMRRRQGRDAEVRTLRRWLLEEYPASDEAAEVLWSRGSSAEGSGRLDEALAQYRALAAGAREHARAGQARMRTGQIHLRRGDRRSAAQVFERYLADFPEGRRWQEAAYWAGRTRMELGDTAAAEAHLRRALAQPIEYYAVMAADLLGIDYVVDLPEGSAPQEPGWLTEGLVRLDLLNEAGLEGGAADEIARLRERADGSRPVQLRLAQSLTERGRTIEGINIGWSVLAEEATWDRHLLRVTFPFPYEELVRREAAEWGIDVFMMAAIIRQESAFKADIVSRAGAIGLMQVMPPTGAQLARAHGPSGFTEASLTRPEVNLHLGAAFFVDMSARYDDDLPLVLSAYNAGPTRATRWRRFPEASDPLRFTERIPIAETRGYVKSVRRNLGLYRALYGQD